MLVHGTVARIPIADNSIDAIFTDPPYSHSYLNCYKWLASEAQRILKPGGFLMAMLGGSYKNVIFRYLDDAGLTYYWDYSFKMNGAQTGIVWKHSKGGNKPIVIRTKSMLIYSNGKSISRTGTVDLVDALDSGQNWQRFHKWGQSVMVARYYIDCFTSEGQLIYDPFIGGGSTGLACSLINRRFLGSDLDPYALLLSRDLIGGKESPMPDESLFAGMNINLGMKTYLEMPQLLDT